MQYKVELPLYVSWSALKKLLGWPYGRAHTWRMMFEPEYAHDPFPLRGKLSTHRSARVVWYTPHVLDYFKRHGLPVPEDIDFS